MIRRPLLILVASAVSLLCLAAVGLWVRFRQDPVSHRIGERVSRHDAQPIDFGEIIPFEWERVYFFDCYSSRTEIEERLGFAWPGLGGSSIEMSDSVTLIVFVKDGGVVRSFDHPRSQGDFGRIENPHDLTKEQARFIVRREGPNGCPYMALVDAVPAATNPATTQPAKPSPPADKSPRPT